MNKLYIYLLTQAEARGWDTYDSAVVIAANKQDAAQIHPYEDLGPSAWDRDCWCKSPDMVDVQLIGVATNLMEDGTVICASFNAG